MRYPPFPESDLALAEFRPNVPLSVQILGPGPGGSVRVIVLDLEVETWISPHQLILPCGAPAGCWDGDVCHHCKQTRAAGHQLACPHDSDEDGKGR